MRRVLIALALASALVVTVLVVFHSSGARGMSEGVGESASLVVKNIGTDVVPQADPSVTAEAENVLSPEGELVAKITAAQRAYSDIVHATGMPSALKVKKRLEIFEQAADELAALGETVVPLLLDRLDQEKDGHSRLLFLTALSRVEGDAGIEGTLEALRRLDDPTVEQVFLDRLTRSLDARDILVVEEILNKSRDPETRMTMIANAVSRRDSSFAVYLPEIAARDPDPIVRQQALVAGARLEAQFDVQLLEDLALLDGAPAVQSEAVKLYAATSPGDLVDLALDVLDEQPPAEVQRSLIEVLAQSDDIDADMVLRQIASSAADETVRRRALAAIERRIDWSDEPEADEETEADEESEVVEETQVGAETEDSE